MTAKQYLRQLWRIEQNIRILSEEIEERRTRLESTAAPTLGDKVQSSPSGDRFADMIAALADKDQSRKALIFEYECLRDRIVAEILEVPNEMYRTVLYEYYVKRVPLKAIAVKTHYSEKYIYEIHRSALYYFERCNKLIKYS